MTAAPTRPRRGPPVPAPARLAARVARVGERLPAWWRQATLAALGAGTCLLVNVVDPNDPGALGVCPFRLVTGLDCPGCGVLRATRALTRGDVAQALDHNALAMVVLPMLLAMLVSAWRSAASGGRRRPWTPPPAVAVAVAVAVPAFWVVRNLPAGAWLAAGLA